MREQGGGLPVAAVIRFPFVGVSVSDTLDRPAGKPAGRFLVYLCGKMGRIGQGKNCTGARQKGRAKQKKFFIKPGIQVSFL